MRVQVSERAAFWAEGQSFALGSSEREVLAGSLRLFFVLRCQLLELAMQSHHQFFEAGHSQKIKLDQFHHPSGWTLAGIKFRPR